MKLILISFAMLFSSNSALACIGNYDCEAGSKCIKEGTSVYGVCTKSPYSLGGAPSDSGPKEYGAEKAGNSCYGNYDCGAGGKCVKVGNAIEGVCTK